MKAILLPLLVLMVGSVALVLGSNSTAKNDTLLAGSHRVETRQVVPSFKPSLPPPSGQLKAPEGTQGGKTHPQHQQTQAQDVSLEDDTSSSTPLEAPDTPNGAKDRVFRLKFHAPASGRDAKKNQQNNNNNTIDTSGTDLYGHVAHSFAPAYPPLEPPPHPHHHEHHIIHEPHHKPLKPSVVHRDPHAHFNHYDAIRTEDYDRQHQVYPVNKVVLDDGAHGLHGHAHAYGYGHGHGSYDSSKAYQYDIHVVPECAHKNRYYYNLTFCLEDSYYPTETILWAIHQSGKYAEKLLTDVTYQSADNLVDGLTRAEEEGYTYQHYFGASHQQHLHLEKFKPPYDGYTYSPEYYKKGGYICPSNIYYARPRRAMNTFGKWKVIVNLDYIPKEFLHQLGEYGYEHYGSAQKHQQAFTQTLRLEQCFYSNAPCSYIDSHVHSRCLQKHNFVRLVAWTYEQGLHVDTFKMPIACSCHIKQPVHYYQPTLLVHQPQY